MHKDNEIHAVAGKDGSGLLYEDGGNTPDYADNFTTTKMESSTSGNTDEYTIAPRQITGKVNGLKDARSYTFRIYNTDRPQSVAVSGKKIDASKYTYDPATRTLVVATPSTKCSAPLTLTVKH